MGNTIRCCIACILPCGALDVVRIIHSNGRVEELSGTVYAADIIKAHPKHILKKPSSRASDATGGPRIVVVPPDALLQRGKIYFLIPAAASSSKASKRRKRDTSLAASTSFRTASTVNTAKTTESVASLSTRKKSSASALDSDRYLSELLSEKVSTQRDRRRRVAVWRPHLESITETTSAGEIEFR